MSNDICQFRYWGKNWYGELCLAPATHGQYCIRHIRNQLRGEFKNDRQCKFVYYNQPRRGQKCKRQCFRCLDFCRLHRETCRHGRRKGTCKVCTGRISEKKQIKTETEIETETEIMVATLAEAETETETEIMVVAEAETETETEINIETATEMFDVAKIMIELGKD